jgi:LPS export ABC transporter protein LptC
MKRAHLVAVLAIALVAGACGEEQPVIPVTQSEMAQAADQVLSGVQHLLTSAGVQQANLTADTAYFFDQGSRIELRVVKVEFFSKTGVPTGTLTSREGTYRQRGQLMEARGDVVVVGEDGRRLTTQQLAFNQATNKITTDSAWTMTQTNGDVGRGVGFETDPNLTSFFCKAACGGAIDVHQPPPG